MTTERSIKRPKAEGATAARPSIERAAPTTRPKRTVYIIGGGGSGYANWTQSEVVADMEDATFCLLSGGEDVTPSLYGKREHPTTYCSPQRDAYELKQLAKARALDKPVLGICRGSQLACVWSGGQLVQHQENPRYLHEMQTYDGKTIVATSTHHQAQMPWNLAPDRFKILAWTTGLSRFHLGEDWEDELVIGKVPGEIEVEAAVYHETKCLALQSHPEAVMSDYLEGDPDAVDYINWCRGLLDRHLDGTLCAAPEVVAETS